MEQKKRLTVSSDDYVLIIEILVWFAVYKITDIFLGSGISVYILLGGFGLLAIKFIKYKSAIVKIFGVLILLLFVVGIVKRIA